MKPMAEASTGDCGINIRFHRFCSLKVREAAAIAAIIYC
jgi:hypothetical protein